MARTYYAFGRTWGEGARCEFAMRTLEETVYQHSLEIQFVALTLIEANDECDWLHKIFDEIFKGMWRGSIWSGIKELRQSLYEGAVLQRCSNFPIETEELLGMLDSLIQTLGYDMGTLSLNKLRESLEFLKKITLFAKFRGLEHRRMGDLFIHVQRLIVGVASLIFTSCSWPRDDEVDPLIETIKPVEYHGCRIYVRVLEEASKLQSSNCAPAGSHALILEMVESLIFLLLELFFSGTSYVGMFHHQMHTLYAGLRFLRNTLTVHRNKFEESYDGKMVNLVEVLICEAAMIVCYLCVKMPNNHVVEPLQHLFYEVDEKMKMIKETQGEAPRYPLKPTSCFPQTNLLGFIDSVLEKLDSFNLYECNPVVTTEKTKFLTIRKDMVFVRSFLIDFMGPLDQNEKVQALWSRVTAVVHEIEYVLDSLVIGDAIQNFLGMLNTILEQMKLVQNEAFEISRCVGQIPKVQNIAESHTKIPQAVNIPGFDEPKVELHDEVQKIIDRLTRGTKQLDVVSIVGMAGLGKTTLAKKVYRNPAIVYYFHDFVWCTISQVYDKKRLLLEVLMGLDNDFADKHSYMSEDDLADAIRRRLKRKRYLVILDDIWDIEAWGSLKLSFPDDAMGSRILLTSRNENVALQIGPKSQPFSLRLLTEKESWELFKMKIRFGEACPPPELVARGEAIVQRCKGLPLTIIIVAGLLSNMDTCVIQLLGHLKYLTLAVEGEKFILPPSIASLSNLETLFLIGGGIYYSRVLLPDTLWKMKNFRHLHCINSHWELPADDRLEHISILENLQTFSNVELSSHQVTKEVVRRFPNIRRFKCRFNVSTPQSIALDFLTQLESLSIYDVRILSEIHNDHYQFPHNLKKLTLQGLHLPWSKISMIDRLPNLEVLKLEQGSFIGEIWDMKEEGTFPKLRFLKLKGLDLARWTDSDDHFPCLQKLVLEDCQKLKELPSCLAEIPTIRMIEVSRCAKAIVDSIKQIRDTQMDNGNVDLEIRRRRQLGKRSYRRVT
ncbi:OLC1v1000593C5 [Oldenlandia corymbosa var. corymbosa]|uniref:OLC1v1000593C5 n=1 Tax=Oldenlandia corymbosa var. corymbosa TaxID=529605 RepID=A0AAV1D3K9_OLDCO|nr:OLC1v1000593C5 [Oldenlandia corymbosa var. corymbosa]